ncbi:unnamed protein product, partial [Brenthis ino]
MLLVHNGYAFRLKNKLAYGKKQWYCTSRTKTGCHVDVTTVFQQLKTVVNRIRNKDKFLISPSILTEEHSGYAILILEQSKEVATTSQLLDISTVDSRQKPKIILPEIIRPFPKSAPRKSKRFGRQPGKTKILTKTPEKQDLEQDHCKPKKMKTKVTKNKQKGKTKKRTVKRQVLQSSESETDLEGEPKYVSSDSTWDELPDRSDSWFCFVCGADEKIDMRLCMICGKYVHEMCVGLSKEDKEEFICPLCSN